MDNSQTLELQIQSKASEAKLSVEGLVKSLTNVENVLTNIYLEMGKIEKNGLKTTTKNVENLKQTVDKTTTSTNKLGSSLKTAFTYAGVKRLTTTLLGWMDEAVNYTEQLNLFNVVFNNIEKNGKKTFSALGEEATRFQYKLNEKFGTNKTETLYMQGIFQSMGETVGIKDKYSAIMSETMTKLTYDLASLYNKGEEATAEAIRAGVYAGQTKPLRSFGIDVTQMSMQPILNELGIDRQVKELSQAEKEILRYLATLKQAKIAMGDFANNLESPANQMKIFKQQLVETKVALSSLFIGTFAKILPYANAILMVIKEVTKAIATMFGIELKDYNTGIASQEGVYDGIADSAGKATKKAKELKRTLFGWDEVHNIDENKDSGSGSGTSIGGGIDQRLLDAIKGYDNGMDKVRMKATEIRDKIMEWLGFTKEIDPLTGAVSFKYGGIKKTLQNMWKSFKGLSTEGKILVGLGLVVGASKLWNTGKKLVTVFGNSGLGKIIKGLISPSRELINWGILGVKTNKNLVSGLKDGIQAWRASNGIIEESTGKVKGFSGVMNGAKVAVQGLITGAAGLYTVNKSMQSLSTDGANLANVLGLVTGSLTTIASGVQIGAIFGPWGAVIGGATGALLTLVSAMKGYQTEVDKMITKDSSKRDSINEYLKSLENENNAIQENLNANLAMTKSHSNLITELESITDANGKVKKGYEERAKYILGTLKNAYGIEYELTNGQISNYDALIKKIKQTIKAKNAEILAEAGKEKYANLLKEETKLWNEKNSAIKQHEKYSKELASAESELKKTEEAINTYMKAGLPVTSDMSLKRRRLKKEVQKLKEEEKEWSNTVKDATNKYKSNILEQTKYSNLQEAIINGNYDEINKAVENFTDNYVKNGEIIKLSLSDRLKKEQETVNIVLSEYKEKYGKEIPEELKNSAYICLNEVINSLVSQTKEVKDGQISEELVNAWYTLGTTNKEKFMENFGKLPKEIQQNVVDKMYEKGYAVSSELQDGIKQINPEINIKTKVQQATVKIDADTSQARKKTNSWLGSLFNGIGKFLGLTAGGFGGGSGGGRFANGGIYSNGSWKSIPQYANGGAPSHGTLFWAGEAGAEIVAHASGKTEVLNQSQIASVMYSAVYSAMSQFGGGGIAEINVRASKDVIVETAINGINQQTNQTGVCPVRIPPY